MYFDLFYISTNIIGYSGNLLSHPTVYFRNGNTFGRITQHHEDRSNIGRNLVRTKGDYRITNTGPDGTAEEFYDGAVKHSSRNRFIPVTTLSRLILERAISRFPYRKPR